MDRVIIVGVGGFVGAVLRFLLTAAVGQVFAERWLVGTLLVNAIGSLLAGGLYALAEVRGLFASPTWLLLSTGVLGSFTTFSALTVECFRLLSAGQRGSAFALALGHIVVGVALVALGYYVVRSWVA
ncbi:MAG TPA: CrcB family protein [Planctomycetota bacterium]|jgi:CrcB protein|nr:CrcB family protein [Planctomycetota bacterium]